MDLQTTGWAVVDADPQVLRDPRSATAAVLTRPSWFDLHQYPTSLFRFVGHHGYETTPGHIQRSLVQEVVDPIGDHVPDVEVLHTDDPEPIDEPAARLVGEVGPTVTIITTIIITIITPAQMVSKGDP